jgi:hypothetical protein
MSNRSRRLLARAVAAVTVAATGPVFIGFAQSPASAAPRAPQFTAPIEADAPYQGQMTCIGTAQPGVVKFRSMILAAYAGTGDSGLTRPCSDGGQSEHKEGRAWDWTVNIKNSKQVAQANDLLNWLWATDQYGNTHAMARRLGIMYIIWNKQIWNAGSTHWAPYSCTGTTACHQDHMHFSFSWAGALAKTSYWTGHVTTLVNPPLATIDEKVLPVTIKVDTRNPATVWTPFRLVGGHKYLLTASGTWSYANDAQGHPMYADAECTLHQSDNAWHRWTVTEGSPGHNENDLWASGYAAWQWTQTNGHACSIDHRFTQLITAGPTQLTLYIRDHFRNDNHGVMSVTISRG